MMTKDSFDVDDGSQDKLTSHNSEAEQCVLGASMLDPAALGAAIDAHLLPEHFYVDAHRVIYQMMVNLCDQDIRVDAITLPDALEEAGLLASIGGGDYLTALVNIVPHEDSIDYYIDIVRKRARTRFIAHEAQDSAVELVKAIVHDDLAAIDRVRSRLEALRHDDLLDDGLEPFWDVDDILAQPDPECWISDMVPELGVTAVIADGGSGKSWMIQDWCLCAATGLDWLGHTVKRGHTFLLIGEGQGDLKNRIRGWLNHHPQIDYADVKRYFHVDPKATQLLKDGQIDRLLRRIHKTVPKGEPIAAVIFDTLAKAMTGHDGDKNAEVSAAIDNADKIKRDVNGAVIIIHHTGKNGDIRGASALRDDTDCTIMLARDQDDTVKVSNSKNRGMAEFEPFCFHLKKEWMDDSMTLTTRLILPMGAKSPLEQWKIGGNAQKALLALCRRPGTPSATWAEWDAIAHITNLSRSIKDLERLGFVLKNGERYAITEKAVSYYQSLSSHSHDSGDSSVNWGKTSLSSLSPPYKGDSDDSRFTHDPESKPLSIARGAE